MTINPSATVEEAIWTLLQADANVTALISTRLYPVQMPQNPTYPNVVYSMVSDRGLDWLASDGGMQWSRYQFDCYARTYTQAKRLARTLRVALNHYSSTVGTIDICQAKFLSELDDFEPVAEIYRVAVDFRIQYA